MKTEVIRARLTKQEKILFEKYSKNWGMSISDYIKYCCLINPPTDKLDGEEECLLEYINNTSPERQSCAK